MVQSAQRINYLTLNHRLTEISLVKRFTFHEQFFLPLSYILVKRNFCTILNMKTK